jgi:hypothetical protein
MDVCLNQKGVRSSSNWLVGPIIPILKTVIPLALLDGLAI